MASHPVYHERVSSLRTEALFVVLALLPLFILTGRWASAGLDGWSALLLFVAAMFVFYSLNYRTLVVRVDGEALRLRFGLFEWTLPLGNIESCSPDATSLWRIGGAGIHFSYLGGRYRVMFNFLEYPRLVVRLRQQQGPVRDVVFSTRKPDEWMALLAPRATSAASELADEYAS